MSNNITGIAKNTNLLALCSKRFNQVNDCTKEVKQFTEHIITGIEQTSAEIYGAAPGVGSVAEVVDSIVQIKKDWFKKVYIIIIIKNHIDQIKEKRTQSSFSIIKIACADDSLLLTTFVNRYSIVCFQHKLRGNVVITMFEVN